MRLSEWESAFILGISICYMMPTRSPNEGVIVQGRRRPEGRVPMLVLAGVLLLLIVAETVREMADAEPERGL